MPEIMTACNRISRSTQLLAAGFLLLAGSFAVYSSARADEVKVRHVGLGTIYLAPKDSYFSASVPSTPDAKYRTQAMLKQAAPTNQWYSSVMFVRWSEPIFTLPATYKAGPDGFEVGYPLETPTPEDKASRIDIVYPHRAALTLSPTGFTPQDARLAGRGDFSATISMGDAAGNALLATVVHGSPFSYYTLSAGDLRVKLAKGAVPCATAVDAQVLCVHALQRDFAVFAPADASWSGRDSAAPVLHFGPSGRFFSVAVLPDAKADTLAEFKRHAYAFVVNTVVDWKYDEATSQVETHFTTQVESREGGQTTPILGLYLHQARATNADLSHGYSYQSIRGTIRTIASTGFSTTYRYHGILPYWGALQNKVDQEKLASVLVGDAARSRDIFTRQQGHGTYWYGKALSAMAQLMCVAGQNGDKSLRDKLLGDLKERLETWFKGEDSSYFIQDARIGTVIGSYDEYGSISHINDHHFHYGYWINAAAQVALRDPDWARKDHWGGMVDLLIADIATSERGRADFPFLRNFDPYEGHSWASGDALFVDGNNQESSSEAVNAWAGLILWGEATGDKALRDKGIWLYTTETEAISDYWFDIRGKVFPPVFGHVVAAQVFGGRYSYNTWWTEEPRQIQGINLMPITPASVYLGSDPAYIKRFMAALGPAKQAYEKRGMSDGTPDDIWQDIFASYLALADPDAALALWKPRGTVEYGETRSHTLYWLLSLKEMGDPDFSVTADTPLYGVFHRASGQNTYLAYNPGDKAVDVHFSDGKMLSVAAHSLGRAN
ncbi:MAG TPA: glycosyl hydrolase [Halothiobacillus sp.]|nr:glycosyl hydrolase [Halothiobacillus sp.]